MFNYMDLTPNFVVGGIMNSHLETDAVTNDANRSLNPPTPASQGGFVGFKRLQFNLPTKSPTKSGISSEWQDYAYQLWQELSNNRRDLPNLFRFVKMNFNRRSSLDSARSFCSDYCGSVPKLKLFYWKFYQSKSGPGGQTKSE